MNKTTIIKNVGTVICDAAVAATAASATLGVATIVRYANYRRKTKNMTKFERAVFELKLKDEKLARVEDGIIEETANYMHENKLSGVVRPLFEFNSEDDFDFILDLDKLTCEDDEIDNELRMFIRNSMDWLAINKYEGPVIVATPYMFKIINSMDLFDIDEVMEVVSKATYDNNRTTSLEKVKEILEGITSSLKTKEEPEGCDNVSCDNASCDDVSNSREKVEGSTIVEADGNDLLSETSNASHRGDVNYYG